MEKTVQQAFDEYCSLVYNLLISNCPVDTGNMQTHIRMDNNGLEARITIDTTPYSKAPQALKKRIKKYGKKSAEKEVEYAEYTEYRNNSKSWVRRRSLLATAYIVGDKVRCEIDV